jgi:hypothetical protein
MNEFKTLRTLRKRSIENMYTSVFSILLASFIIFFLYCYIPTTTNSAIFCPENVDPYYVVEKYHEYHLIKIVDKNTNEIKKSYGEDGMVRLRLLKTTGFMMEVRVTENSKKPPNPVLVMQNLDPSEYVDVETRYRKFEKKDWGLR